MSTIRFDHTELGNVARVLTTYARWPSEHAAERLAAIAKVNNAAYCKRYNETADPVTKADIEAECTVAARVYKTTDIDRAHGTASLLAYNCDDELNDLDACHALISVTSALLSVQEER